VDFDGRLLARARSPGAPPSTSAPDATGDRRNDDDHPRTATPRRTSACRRLLRINASAPSGSTFAARGSSIAYDSEGYFATSMTNPRSQVMQTHMRAEDGQTDSVDRSERPEKW